jgi:hypothetical protein
LLISELLRHNTAQFLMRLSVLELDCEDEVFRFPFKISAIFNPAFQGNNVQDAKLQPTKPLTYLLACLLTYLLSPCSRVLLEKLTGSQLVKIFPAVYGNRKFITAFTRGHHLSSNHQLCGDCSNTLSFSSHRHFLITLYII